MIPDLVIRTFQYPDDLPAVLDLWKKAGKGIDLGRSDTEAELIKKLKHDPELFLVAELDTRLAGAVLGGFDGRRGIVYHLAVSAEEQCQGVGAALMDELENRLSRLGCLRSYLLVKDGNEQARQFYEHHGWAEMPHHIYGKDLA